MTEKLRQCLASKPLFWACFGYFDATLEKACSNACSATLFPDWSAVLGKDFEISEMLSLGETNCDPGEMHSLGKQQPGHPAGFWSVI